MHSSTSSSEIPIPSGRWSVTWGVALAVSLALAILFETQARRLGVLPSWSAGAESWCVEASALGSRDVVILGSSRAISGIEPGTLAEIAGRPVRQLSINATSMLPVLEWLASREDFTGVVLADVIPGLEFRAGAERHAVAERFVVDLADFSRSPARRIDAVLSRQVQTSLAFRSPGFHLIAPYRDRGGAGVSRLSRMSVEATRFVRLEFQPGEPGAPEKKPEAAAAKRAGPEECESLMGRFDKAIRSIEAHGGRVVLLFMPLTGASADIEERDFPRSEYWDPISPSSKALRVHFRDYPALAGFTCPDGEHLDGVDAVRFTRALADILGSHLD